jgi:transcriptional regulator with XRE-family HTH domain
MVRNGDLERRKRFASWLQAQLNQRDWTQTDLAKRSGISSGRISDYVRAVRIPGPINLRKIADALAIDPERVYEAAGFFSREPEFPPDESIEEEMIGLIRQVDWTPELAEPILIQLRLLRDRRRRQ